jgi:hypothetical protein
LPGWRRHSKSSWGFIPFGEGILRDHGNSLLRFGGGLGYCAKGTLTGWDWQCPTSGGSAAGWICFTEWSGTWRFFGFVALIVAAVILIVSSIEWIGARLSQYFV